MPVDEFLKEAQTSPVTAVEKAIAHPQVINFAPLLQVPQVCPQKKMILGRLGKLRTAASRMK